MPSTSAVFVDNRRVCIRISAAASQSLGLVAKDPAAPDAPGRKQNPRSLGGIERSGIQGIAAVRPLLVLCSPNTHRDHLGRMQTYRPYGNSYATKPASHSS